VEIWQDIFSIGEFDSYGRFWSTYDHPTMASISRCCTMFHDLIRPTLYCNFDSHVFTGNKCRWFGIVEFARTICTSPYLASMVRRVAIRGICDTNYIFGKNLAVVSKDDPRHPTASVLLSRAAEQGMDFEYYEAYAKKPDTSAQWAFVGFDLIALILAQLPSLHTLHLSWVDTTDFPPPAPPRGGWPWIDSSR
jgi:hypothetical protein